MQVDITALSSDELFELARQKKQHEEEFGTRRIALEELKERRRQLEIEHAKALAGVDQRISELHLKRGQLVIKHKAAVDAVDQEIVRLTREAKNATAAAAPPNPNATADLICALTAGRPYISESLLKEQLRAKGHDVSRLPRILDLLVRDGRLLNKGSGNYAPGKRVQKKSMAG